MVFFISNKYGADELGLFSLSLTILNIAVLLPKFGFEHSLVRILGEIKVKGNKKDFYGVLNKTIRLSFFLSLLASLVLYILSDFLAITIFKNDKLTPYIKSIVLAIPPITLLTIVSSTFQALKKTFNHILYKTAFINVIFTLFLVINFYLIKEFKETFTIYTYAVYVVFFYGSFSLKRKLSSYDFKDK